jgi:hypothetical protein
VNALLLVAVLLLTVVVLPLLVYILIKERTVNIHHIWALAARGHRLARVYMATVVLAFCFAVASFILAVAQQRAERAAKHVAANPSIERTAKSTLRVLSSAAHVER